MKFSRVALFALSLAALAPSGAWAQGFLDSTAATGDFSQNTGNFTGSQTRQDVDTQAVTNTEHDNWVYSRSMQRNNTLAPDTLRTRTKGYLNGQLDRASTELMAPFSVNRGGFNSGSFSLGFGGGGSEAYTGPYGSGKFGGKLPVVSTGSVDLDVTSGLGGFNLGGPEEARQFQDMARENITEDDGSEVQRPSQGDTFNAVDNGGF